MREEDGVSLRFVDMGGDGRVRERRMMEVELGKVREGVEW